MKTKKRQTQIWRWQAICLGLQNMMTSEDIPRMITNPRTVTIPRMITIPKIDKNYLTVTCLALFGPILSSLYTLALFGTKKSSGISGLLTLLSGHSWFFNLDLSLLTSHSWLVTFDLPLLTCRSWRVSLDISLLTCHFRLLLSHFYLSLLTCNSWLELSLLTHYSCVVTLHLSLLTFHSQLFTLHLS